MKYLGIDFGTRKVGVSVSDKEGTLAFPYTLIVGAKDIVNEIKAIVLKEGIEHIILGYSINNHGQENSIMTKVHEFKSILEEKVCIPVSYQKEFMTSVFARQDFLGKVKNNARQIKQRKAGDDDMAAATLILQRYLDGKTRII
jgi:putative Holliday junction resolvase